MKIYIQGRDYSNWSIDDDNENTYKMLSDLFPGQVFKNNQLEYTKLTPVRNIADMVKADIIHSVYYTSLARQPKLFLKSKKCIATVTNEYKSDNKIFYELRDYVDIWIASSKKIVTQMNNDGLTARWNPYYTDETIFKNIHKSKEELCNLLGIDLNIIKNKYVIGSFQKDSSSANINEPRLQKGPDILLNILKKIPNKNEWIVLLAGPMRDYLINNFKRLRIPYYYYGNEKLGQNFDVNNIDKERVNLLYNLIDCYIVSSRSEGGPKAILESILCQTPVISTNVGYAEDFLSQDFIYNTEDGAVSLMNNLIKSKDKNDMFIKDVVLKNYNNAILNNSYSKQLERLSKIYSEIIKF